MQVISGIEATQNKRLALVLIAEMLLDIFCLAGRWNSDEREPEKHRGLNKACKKAFHNARIVVLAS